VLSGYGLGWLAGQLADVSKISSARRWALIVGLAAVAFYLIDLEWVLRVDRQLVSVRSYDLHRTRQLPDPISFLPAEEAVGYLQDVTQPAEFVLTDAPMIAFRAGRRVPPPLNVISHKRVDSGELGEAEIVAAVHRYQPAAILLWHDRLTRYAGFGKWIEHRYTRDQGFGANREAWVADRLAPNIRNPLRVIFGDQVQLSGYNLWAPEVKPGGVVQMMLFWQAHNPLPGNYVIFAHLVRDGKIWAQVDGQPVEGSYPTSWWAPGELILDPRIVELPDDIPAGRYDVLVGLYDPATLRRLPITVCEPGTVRCADNAATLSSIEVAAP
jgi:hypothetical protein